MTPLHDLFASDLSPWLAMMAQWFVKGALVLAAAGLLTAALRKRAAAVRYLVWCAALLEFARAAGALARPPGLACSGAARHGGRRLPLTRKLARGRAGTD